MQAVAKKAEASMETLYRWYGDKRGHFRALVARTAEDLRAGLQTSIDTGGDPDATPAHLGPRLLALRPSEGAVALNRAASAGATGELGRAVGDAGREVIVPRLVRLLERRCADLARPYCGDIAEIYISLLIGDLQIRRVTGSMQVPGPEALRQGSERARRLIAELFPGSGSRPAAPASRIET